MGNGYQGSTRSQRLPPHWKHLRGIVVQRAGGTCETPGCNNPGTDVDHITRGDNHALQNLQLLCPPCHRRKTSTEANTQRWNNHRTNSRHPREQHPGLTP